MKIRNKSVDLALKGIFLRPTIRVGWLYHWTIDIPPCGSLIRINLGLIAHQLVGYVIGLWIYSQVTH